MKSILVFDDDNVRANRFFATVSANTRDVALAIARTPQAFIDSYLTRATKPDLISLHWTGSLGATGTHEDRGGMDAASFLADCDGACPVLVHSTDDEIATKMLETLLYGGWIATRFRTFGSDWIENHWFPYVRRSLSIQDPFRSFDSPSPLTIQ